MAINRKIGKLEDWKDCSLTLPTFHPSIQSHENIDLESLHNWAEAETR